MYSLFKSEVIPVHHAPPKLMTSYRQVSVHNFKKLEAALTACQIYNDKSGSDYYVINESGKKYHEGAWVDYSEP